jgi:hypothetical protein
MILAQTNPVPQVFSILRKQVFQRYKNVGAPQYGSLICLY